MEPYSAPIAILGAGSWGTALALHLAGLGQAVRLWTYNAIHVEEMQRERVNTRYLPGFPFPPSLQPVATLDEAIDSNIGDIIIAVPSANFHDTLVLLKPYLTNPMRIAWATKGLDIKTGKLLHDVAVDVLGTHHIYAVLSGPSFAREVAAGLPTAVVAASYNAQFTNDIITRFNSPSFRVYSSKDIIGVETGGIVKNVLAIATGISDGMGFGANARSALITRGLVELTRLGTALGGHQETFTGLSGLGDLILTCTDDQSRNRRFGLALGRGKNPAEIEHEIGQVVEGVRNSDLVMQLAQQYSVEMPITQAVWEILHHEQTPKTAMQNLFAREPKAESTAKSLPPQGEG